jgi:hypothetical protein
MNVELQRRGKFKENDRRIYCGAYRLTGAAVRALASTEGVQEVAFADVIHHPENGEIAHTDLRIVFKPGDFDVEGTKTAIVDRLWSACCGPLRCVCQCDHDVQDHPSVDLPSGPAGEYKDTRGRFSRHCHLVRFYVCSWIARLITRKAVNGASSV